MEVATASKNMELSEIQSALSIKINELEKQQALFRHLAANYQKLKSQTLEDGKV